MNNQWTTESQINANVSNDVASRGAITVTETTTIGAPFSRFISLALKGTYQSAERYRPKYIQLFNGDQAVSGRILNNTTVRVEPQEENTNDFYQATFHFRIPYSYFQTDSGTINCLKLFCAAEEINPSATITLEGTSLPRIEKNYNLYIDWTIRLKGDTDE